MLTPEEWGSRLEPKISARRVRVLCEEGRVRGARRIGEGNRALWQIPEGAPDPRKAPGRPKAEE